MRQLGLFLKDRITDSVITRPDKQNITFRQRVKKGVESGCDTLISIHTNAPPAKGIMVFYSIFRPEDKALAKLIAKALSKELGIKIRGVMTRKSQKGNWDYYGIIRNSINAGLAHVLIVEHGDHSEFAMDIENNIKAVYRAYKEVFEKMNVSRIAGYNRYHTAALVSELLYPQGVDTIILTTGENLVDGIVSGPLAGNLDVPILLTKSDVLSEYTLREIKRLNAKNVIVIGGNDAISQEVKDVLTQL